MQPSRERDSLLDQRDHFGGPALGSVALHLAFVAALAGLAFLNSRLHGDLWGNSTPGGAIQATLVSSAPALPLPQDHPPTENVLATETPSPAPVQPAPKAEAKQEEKAIPIPVKQPEKAKPDQKKSAPQPKTAPPNASTQKAPQHPQPTAKQDNRAQYGEGAPTHLARSTPGQAGASSSSPVAASGDFGSRFGWYVAVITRKVKESWYTQEVDPHTSAGRQVVVTFVVSRDGTPGSVRIVTSSGSPTLDTSALRAVQRVDTFGALPPEYRGNNVSVAYTFTYDQPNR